MPHKTAETNDGGAEGAQNLLIAVRIRPFKAEEAAKGWIRSLEAIDDKMVVLYEKESNKLDALRAKRSTEKQFKFDVSFGEKTTQDHVYQKTTKPLIQKVLSGYNATIFAYGPTGTGKTYTMVGTKEAPGIMVRALNDLFKHMQQATEKFKVSLSYLEIYNETIRDLLTYTGKTLDLQEDKRHGCIKIPGLSTIQTTNTHEVMRLLEQGNRKRISESTAANKTSSRSHALLQVNVTMSSHGKNVDEIVKNGTLIMVDLAGSERARTTQNVGVRLQEGANINKSLLALGNVIKALAEGKVKYVNYRDSKLTRLLKDALSGNCQTVMITHVSPADAHREETRNTLTYADRAKEIATNVKENIVDVEYHISKYKLVIKELKDEIERLRGKIGDDVSHPLSTDIPSESQEKLSKLKQEIRKSFDEKMSARKKLMGVEHTMIAIMMEIEKQNTIIHEWQKKKANKLSVSSEDTDSDEDEPEDVKHATEYISYLHNELTRHQDIKDNIKNEIDDLKHKSKLMEENLSGKTSSIEQRELLQNLCKVHELEIQKVELEISSIVKEHEIRKRDQQIQHYEKQRLLCEKIITRQRTMLEESPSQTDLRKWYLEYELENKNLSDRSPSVMSRHTDKLPLISPTTKDTPEKLFVRPGRRLSVSSEPRPSTPLALRSPLSSAHSSPPSTGNKTSLPPIPLDQKHKSGNQAMLTLADRTRLAHNSQLKRPVSHEEIALRRSRSNITNDPHKRRIQPLQRSRSGSLPVLNHIGKGKLTKISSNDDKTLSGRIAKYRREVASKKHVRRKRSSSLNRGLDRQKNTARKSSRNLRPPLQTKSKSQDDLFKVGPVMRL